MCGRFTLTAPADAVASRFEVGREARVVERYNVAPTQAVPVVRVGAGGSVRELVFMRWGLLPSWSKELGAGFINARAETVATKPSFRSSFRRRRCLVPADGFYEWQKQGKQKLPFHIRLHEGELFAFAGLWDSWKAPDGSLLESCAVVTTEANELLRPLHDRMPVILAPAAYELWLDPGVQDVERLQALLRPYPAREMEARSVGSLVNTPRQDHPDCLKPGAKTKCFEQGNLFE